jgi:hypothetical protein
MRPLPGLAVALLAAAVAAPADAASRFNWNALGTEFCRLTLAGDMQGIRALLTEDLRRTLDAAAARADLLPARVLFQSYTNPVPLCQAVTRNAALVEIHRGGPGNAPSWIEYIVVVPERDGTSRIDDVLFATRKSDTLRARLDYLTASR